LFNRVQTNFFCKKAGLKNLMPNDSSFSGGFATATPTGSQNLSPLTLQKINSYRLDINEEVAVQLSGVKVETDAAGNYAAISYDSGSYLRHHSLYTLVKTSFGTIWLGDQFGYWHPLD